jgi:integrase/recombinase XerD
MSKKRAGELQVVRGGRPTEWERIIGDFEASAQASGLSFRTVEHYSDVLRRVLHGYCTRNEIEPQALTKRDLERLSAELFEAGRSRQSVKTYMSAINRFLKWCAEEEGLTGLRGPEPKVERRILDVLTREEIGQIEEAAVTERDKLIVRVLADTGIRVGELRGLRTGDLVADGRERYLRVVGRSQGGGAKGDSSRLVPITPGLYMRLDRYVRRGRPECNTDRLFVTLERRPSGDYEPLAERSIQGMVEMLGRKAGIKKKVHPHLFRHSLATNLLRKHVNPVQVRDILGHTSLAMIDRVYSHLAASDAHEALMSALRADD